MKIRMTAILLAASLTAAALSGCGNPGSQPVSSAVRSAAVSSRTASSAAESAAQELTANTAPNVCIGAEPASLDPALSTGPDTDSYCAAAFEGLYKVNAAGQVVLGQAEKAACSADKKVWTFTLRSDAEWSDGKPVKAEDFVFAWRRNARMADAEEKELFAYLKNGTAVLNGTMDVAALGVSAPNARTLKVTLNAECDFLPQMLVRPIFMPLRKDIVGKKNWDRNPNTFVCNGPMKMARWNVKSNIIYDRSNTYYHKSAVTASCLTCTLSEDDGARLSAYDNNETEFISPLPVKYYARIRERGDFLEGNAASTLCLQFSAKDTVLSDVQVRQALSLAIDRDALAVSATGMRFSAAGAFVPSGFTDAGHQNDFRKTGGTYFASSASGYEANVKHAQSLLEQAGYSDGKNLPQLTISIPISTLYETAAGAVANMWKSKLGINCKIEQLSYSAYRNACKKGNFQITMGELITAYDDPSSILEQFAVDSRLNQSGWKDSSFMKQMEKARQCSTASAERFQALHAAEKRLSETLPAVPLIFLPSMSLRDSNLNGVFTAENGITYFAYANRFSG